MNLQKINAFLKCGHQYGIARAKALHLTTTEHHICVYVYFHALVNQDTIAQELSMDKTTVAKALHTLAQKQLILRQINPANRRENQISISPYGIERIRHMAEIYQQWLQQVSSVLTPEEMEQFDDMWDRLLQRAMELKENANDR